MVEFSPKSAAAYTQLAKTTLQLAHVSELLWLFHRANVPLILLKGIALVGRVYPAAEQRPMQDIDVVVRRADFERAAALLQVQGYAFSNKASVWNEAFARWRSAWLVTRPTLATIALRSFPPASLLAAIHLSPPRPRARRRRPGKCCNP